MLGFATYHNIVNSGGLAGAGPAQRASFLTSIKDPLPDMYRAAGLVHIHSHTQRVGGPHFHHEINVRQQIVEAVDFTDPISFLRQEVVVMADTAAHVDLNTPLIIGNHLLITFSSNLI